MCKFIIDYYDSQKFSALGFLTAMPNFNQFKSK